MMVGLVEYPGGLVDFLYLLVMLASCNFCLISTPAYQPCADVVSGILNIALGGKTGEEYSEITDETSDVGRLLFGNPNIGGDLC
jgi:hypothetical protein